MDNQKPTAPNDQNQTPEPVPAPAPTYPDPEPAPAPAPSYPDPEPAPAPAPTYPDPESASVPGEPTPNYYDPAPENVTPAPKSKTGLITIGAIALIIIGIVVWMISCSLSNSPKATVKKFFEAAYNCDFKTADSYQLLGGEDYYKYLAEKEDEDIDEYFEEISGGEASNYNEFCEAANSVLKQQISELYGKNATIKVEEITEVKFTDKELKDLKEEYKDDKFIDSDKITDAYNVTVISSINNSKTSENKKTNNVTAIKYKGKWKIHEQ